MAIDINTPVQYLKGVGPKLGDVLRKRGVETIGDLLEWFPRAYEDRRKAQSISTLSANQIVSLKAQILVSRSMNLGRSKRKMYEVIVKDETGRISCKFFRVPYRGYFDRFEPHQMVRVNGRVTDYRGHLEFHHPDIHPVTADEESGDIILPLYTETEGLSAGKLKKIIAVALEHLAEFEVESLPQWLLKKYNLMPRSEALKEIHQPPPEISDQLFKFTSGSQRRLIFEEFFWLELLLAARKRGIEREIAKPILTPDTLSQKLTASLEFELTAGQIRTFAEIKNDLKAAHPMHRLVQGDVGSGKTMVAFLSCCFVAEAGMQSAMMVPTEILADQHYRNAKARLEPLGLRVALLTGSLSPQEKREVYSKLAKGEVDVCVGTHALIQQNVEFKNLNLVVVDEQHRFGVSQRQTLQSKGRSPHFLVMTATPIPRTLAMTVYGDLDVSILRELPKGRQPIVTKKAFAAKRPQVFDFVETQLKSGRQAYIVYPLVEESEKLDLKNAMAEFEAHKLRFKDFSVGLLHGRMKAEEKDKIMGEFRDHKIDVLVSTTVIEVGVDVPNSNIIVIEHAERFGLSQLHQLRGRVGRGKHKSFCVLVLGYAVSEESIHRAEIMESTTDGFVIAEEDLAIRGPGEMLGTKQSGLFGFKIANLIRDAELLQLARDAAFEVLARDANLSTLEHQQMKSFLEHKGLKFVA